MTPEKSEPVQALGDKAVVKTEPAKPAHVYPAPDPAYFDERRIWAQEFAGQLVFGTYHRLFTRLKIEGRENLPPEDTAMVIVGNHKSFYDPPLFQTSTNRKMVYFAKQELWHNWLLGRILTWLGAVPINRDKPEKSRIKFLIHMMKQGWSLGMFIEGTRCRLKKKLGRPNVGPAYFARLTKAPILPIGFINTDQRFGPVIVRIGKLIQPKDDVVATTWEIMDALSELTGYEIAERKLANEKD